MKIETDFCSSARIYELIAMVVLWSRVPKLYARRSASLRANMRFILLIWIIFLSGVATFHVSAQNNPGRFEDPNTLMATSIQSNWTKLIVVIHGWNPGSSPDPFTGGPWPQLLSNLDDATKDTAYNGWHVVAYNWWQDAATESIAPWDVSSWENANTAAGNANWHGSYLGNLLAQFPNLREVQFIAHSAGSWAARGAAQLLLAKNHYVLVQVTLLDPYIPDAALKDILGVVGATGMNTALMSDTQSYSDLNRVQRLENYYANDSATAGWDLSKELIPTPGTQETFTWRGGIDINQMVNWGPQLPTSHYDWHAGPIQFYADTVETALPGGTISTDLPIAPPPYDYTKIGFYLSLPQQDITVLPRITLQPQDQSAQIGVPTTLSVGVVGATAYTWYQVGGGGGYMGSQSTLTLPNTAAGTYTIYTTF